MTQHQILDANIEITSLISNGQMRYVILDSENIK